MTSRSSRVEEESRGGSGSGSGEEARGEKGITPRARCINNDQKEREREREEKRNTGATVACLGLAVPTPRTASVRTFASLPYFDSQAERYPYRMLPYVTKSRGKL